MHTRLSWVHPTSLALAALIAASCGGKTAMVSPEVSPDASKTSADGGGAATDANVPLTDATVPSPDATAILPVLSAITLAGPGVLAPAFNGTVEAYSASLSVSNSDILVTATTTETTDTLMIDGSAATSGVASPAIALSLGDNPIAVKVTNAEGVSRTYTLTITRASYLLDQIAYVKASNTQTADTFGDSIAVFGDILAVGATGEDSNATGVGGTESDNSAALSGAVYLFHRSGSTWTQEAYLKAANGSPSDKFGFSLALSGDTLAVGAPYQDSAGTGAANRGMVYVYRRNGGSWNEEGQILSSTPRDGDNFGISLSLDVDTLAVGAYNEDSGFTGVQAPQGGNFAPNSGAAYVFKRTGTAWALEAFVKASNTGTNDNFGQSIAVSGDTLVVGAPNEDSAATGINPVSNEAAPNSGGAYVYKRSGGNWLFQTFLKASNTQTLDLFGRHVATVGNTIAVGAPHEDSSATGVGGNQGDEGATNSGAVYIFREVAPGGWVQEAYLKANVAGASDFFGSSVALAQDKLVVGAREEDSGASGLDGGNLSGVSAESGAAYLFTRSGTTWTPKDYIKASNTKTNALLGTAVAISADSVVVAAPGENSKATGVNGDQLDITAPNSGAVYVFK